MFSRFFFFPSHHPSNLPSSEWTIKKVLSLTSLWNRWSMEEPGAQLPLSYQTQEYETSKALEARIGSGAPLPLRLRPRSVSTSRTLESVLWKELLLLLVMLSVQSSASRMWTDPTFKYSSNPHLVIPNRTVFSGAIGYLFPKFGLLSQTVFITWAGLIRKLRYLSHTTWPSCHLLS